MSLSKEQIQKMLDEYTAALRDWIETNHESRGGDSIVMLDRWAAKLRNTYPLWKRGDRVTRRVYMDDGTWDREGDTCLEHSPLKHGTVTNISPDGYGSLLYLVQWNNGQLSQYFGHGLNKDTP